MSLIQVGTHALVEPVYQLEKDGKLSPGNGKEAEGREFLGAQLVRGGQMLGDLWFSAWQQAREDTFLIGQLKKRAEAGAAKAAVIEPAAKAEKSEKPDSK